MLLLLKIEYWRTKIQRIYFLSPVRLLHYIILHNLGMMGLAQWDLLGTQSGILLSVRDFKHICETNNVNLPFSLVLIMADFFSDMYKF